MILRKTHTIDADGKTIGRLATQIALILRGKNKPEYQPHIDLGDIVHVKNISDIKITGKKMEQKEYHSYSGYPGGLKTILMKNLKPAQMLERAVKQMLPKTRLRNNMLKRLIIK